MNGVRCVVHESLADIPNQAWNALAGSAGLYSSHEWLLSVERGDNRAVPLPRGPGR